MKKFIKRAARSTPLLLALAMVCSNPVKDVKWRTSVDLPITNQTKFYLGATMDTLFFNKQQVLVSKTYDTLKRAGLPDSIYVSRIDTTISEINAYPVYDTVAKKLVPDTVAFGIPTRDTALDTISEDTLADKYYSDAFGPIPISGVPDDTLNVPLAGSYTAGTQIALPAASITFEYVYHIELTDTPQNVNITVVNNSGASFGAVAITAGTLGLATINNLGSNGAAGTAQFNARAKVIDSVMTVSVAVTPSTTNTFAAGDNLKVIFSLNGLTANKVVVQDTILAKYVRTFTNEYDLTDTVNVNYIDIGTGFFNYIVTNNTGIALQMSVIHRHLWTTSFCLNPGYGRPEIDSLSQLVGLTLVDSGNASNCDIAIRENFPAHSTVPYSRHNLSANRMFPEWNPVKKKSVTKVDYNVSVATYGRRVTLSSADSLNFIIRTPALSFKFTEMYGRSTERYYRTSDPKNIPVNLPWNKAVTDSLRNNFILQKVMAEVATVMNIPVSGDRSQDSAFLDTMHVYFMISSTNDPTKTVSDSEVFVHVTRGKVFTRYIDITKVVNNFPDSVQMKVSSAIPVGTSLKTINDLTDPSDPEYQHHVGRMIIHGIVKCNLIAPLCWTIADTTIMDLGGAKVDMGGGNVSGVTNPIAGMTDKHGSLNVQVTNATNIYMRLYALAATDSAKVGPLVDTADPAYLKTNQFNDLVNHPTAGYVELIDGLLIPPRDSTTAVMNTITLTDQDLTHLLSAKKLGLRYEVRFIPQGAGGIAPDALYNTDWIKLNSWIHIDGINCVDSLFK